MYITISSADQQFCTGVREPM